MHVFCMAIIFHSRYIIATIYTYRFRKYEDYLKKYFIIKEKKSLFILGHLQIGDFGENEVRQYTYVRAFLVSNRDHGNICKIVKDGLQRGHASMVSIV